MGFDYNILRAYSKNLAEFDPEDPEEVSKFGPEYKKEYAVHLVLMYLFDFFNSSNPDKRQSLSEALNWLNTEIPIRTNIHEVQIMTLDIFKVQILYPDNFYAREIGSGYINNNVEFRTLLERVGEASTYEEVIRLYVNYYKMPLTDAVDYVRLILFQKHFLVTPTDDLSNTEYSLDTGLVLTLLLLYGIITYKTFII